MNKNIFLILVLLILTGTTMILAEDEPETAETADIISGEDVFTYRQSFRDPFQDYNRKEEKGEAENDVEEINSEDIKQRLPFELTGIIGNNEKRLAVINTADGSHIIDKGKTIQEFKIVDILENKLIILYRDVTLEIELRGEQDVNKE